IGSLIDAGLYNVADGVSITNDGTITASTSNVSITGNVVGSTAIVGIYNAGSITALTNDSAGSISGSSYGVDNEGSIGTLTNSGIISGNKADINNTSGSIGTLINVGSITSAGTNAVYSGKTITSQDLSVNNTGGT
ncbi:hypothetical protein, partial [Acidocella aminolytica]